MMEIKKSLERDFLGYGGKPPKVEWPKKARIAVSIVINYEEGSEQSLAFGDPVQETYKEIPKPFPDGIRDLNNESVYEYGARTGFWRLIGILKRHKVLATYFACALALERNIEAARAIMEAGHEVCSHGYRWQEPFRMTKEEEWLSIKNAVESFQHTIGERPVGWFSRYGASIETRKLLVKECGFIYDSDSMADDIPYYVDVNEHPFLVLPYTNDVNDIKFWVGGSFVNADDFFTYMKDTFDVLYEEGAEYPKMMTIGLHNRIAGRPGRAKALDEFLAYAKGYKNVWFARRVEIAQWWLNHYPPRSN